MSGQEGSTVADPHQFEARQSSDEVKTDLELTCITCEGVVCDIEHEDSLGTLLAVARDHKCLLGDELPCGCRPHITRTTGMGFHCVTEDQGYCNFECPHEDEEEGE